MSDKAAHHVLDPVMEAVRYEKCAKHLNLVHSLREIINNVLSKILNSVLDHSKWMMPHK